VTKKPRKAVGTVIATNGGVQDIPGLDKRIYCLSWSDEFKARKFFSEQTSQQQDAIISVLLLCDTPNEHIEVAFSLAKEEWPPKFNE